MYWVSRQMYYKYTNVCKALLCWFSHDVTKIQTTKLSILLRFYFHGVLELLETNFQKCSWFCNRVRLNF